MANDYLVISKNNRPQLGSEAIRAANDMIELRDRVRAILNAASRQHDGVTYTTLEAQFGLLAGTGANFVSLLSLINDILNTNVEVTGANRISRLDEFTARLAGQ